MMQYFLVLVFGLIFVLWAIEAVKLYRQQNKILRSFEAPPPLMHKWHDKLLWFFFGRVPPVTQADFTIRFVEPKQRDKVAANRVRYTHEANFLRPGTKSAEALSLEAHMKQLGFWR